MREPVASSGAVPAGGSERDPITSSGVVPAHVTSGGSERDPITSSAVVPVQAKDAQTGSVPSTALPKERKRRRSEPPLRTLTPYQARLDVDMDDTEVSKVRDPSASIRLGPEGDWVDVRRGAFAGTKRTRATNVAQVALGLSFGFLVVWLASLVWTWSSHDPIVIRPSPSAVSNVASTPPGAAWSRPSPPPVFMPKCRLAAEPRRLFGVQRGVPPVVRTVGAQIAVGYGKVPGHAEGMALSPGQHDPDVMFRQWKPRPVERVVPWATPEGEIRFHVQRLGSRATQDVVLGTATHIRIKAGRNGLVMTDEGGRVQSLWPLSGGHVTDIDAVPVGERHAVLVVTQHPSQAWVGWVDSSGLAVSQLFPISVEGRTVERTAVAGGQKSALVVLMLSAGGGAAVVRVPAGAGPESVRRPALVDSSVLTGPLHATPLKDGAWWVQWSEKGSGQERLVGRVVASDLQTVGDPIALNEMEGLALSAGVATLGRKVVSFGLGARDGARELWVTELGCAP